MGKNCIINGSMRIRTNKPLYSNTSAGAWHTTFHKDDSVYVGADRWRTEVHGSNTWSVGSERYDGLRWLTAERYPEYVGADRKDSMVTFSQWVEAGMSPPSSMPIVLKFTVKASPGVYSVQLLDHVQERETSIPYIVADRPGKQTFNMIFFPDQKPPTFNISNGTFPGIEVLFWIDAGSDYCLPFDMTPVQNAWSENYGNPLLPMMTPRNITIAQKFMLTGVELRNGNSTQPEMVERTYEEEAELCRGYYEVHEFETRIVAERDNTGVVYVPFQTVKRRLPRIETLRFTYFSNDFPGYSGWVELDDFEPFDVTENGFYARVSSPTYFKQGREYQIRVGYEAIAEAFIS